MPARTTAASKRGWPAQNAEVKPIRLALQASGNLRVARTHVASSAATGADVARIRIQTLAALICQHGKDPTSFASHCVYMSAR